MRRFLYALLPLATMSVSAAEEPQWLQEARARESTLPKPAVFQSKDRRFKAVVPARVRGGIVEKDGSYIIDLEVGREVEPVLCEIYPESVDMANGIRLLAAAHFDRVAGAQGKVEMREIERTDAGWNGSAAFLSADWIYAVQTDGQKRLGALKQVLFERDGASIYCTHNEIGYRQTFEHVTHGLANSLEWSKATPVARYREVYVATINERRLGVARLDVERDADGDDRVTTSLSMLVPKGSGEVAAHDEVQVEFVTGDGALINALQIVNENDEINTEVRLAPDENGDWLVSGQFSGKEVEAGIPGDQMPRSSIEQYALIGALLLSPEPAGRSVGFQIWSDVNPTVFTDVEVTAVARVDGDLWSARMKVAGMEFDTIGDARDGRLVRTVMPMGHLTMTLERVARLGQL
jgi:hypothetical protein